MTTTKPKPYSRQRELQAFVDSGESGLEIEATNCKSVQKSVESFNRKNGEKIKLINRDDRFFLVNVDRLDF